MKPGSKTHRHHIRITGDELRELKKLTGSMVEAFGLDRKIEKYAGIRPITLYRWDIECLMDVTAMALDDPEAYPDKSTQEYQALARLDARLRAEYDAVYPGES